MPVTLRLPEVELFQDRANRVADVERHAAAGAAGDRRDDEHAHRVVAKLAVCVVWAVAESRLGFQRLADGAANALAGLPGVIGKRQPSQRPQAFGAQRARNVVQPATAQPLQQLLRVFAIVLRPTQRQVQRFVRRQSAVRRGGPSRRALADRCRAAGTARPAIASRAELVVDHSPKVRQHPPGRAADAEHQRGRQPRIVSSQDRAAADRPARFPSAAARSSICSGATASG